jgi:ABC-2 type transport system ATP-binding protein
VSEVDVRADRVSLSSKDSDQTLRALLASFPDAHDIEVTAFGLEDAFLTLTDDDNNEGNDAR